MSRRPIATRAGGRRGGATAGSRMRGAAGPRAGALRGLRAGKPRGGVRAPAEVAVRLGGPAPAWCGVSSGRRPPRLGVGASAFEETADGVGRAARTPGLTADGEAAQADQGPGHAGRRGRTAEGQGRGAGARLATPAADDVFARRRRSCSAVSWQLGPECEAGRGRRGGGKPAARGRAAWSPAPPPAAVHQRGSGFG